MKTVLILEDEPSNMRVFRVALELYGFTVIEAGAGTEALKFFADPNVTIELLIADIRLPGFSGTQLALEFIKRWPDSGILFISGMPMEYWQDSDVSNFQVLPSHRVGFLPKPFLVSELNAAVGKILSSDSDCRNLPKTLRAGA